MNSDATHRLLRQVARRQSFALLAGRFYRWTFLAAAAYAALLLASRLLGILPDWFSAASVPLVPAAALLAAVFFLRRVSAPDAARLIDLKTNSHDLFLTVALVGGATGDYKPVVLDQAETAVRAIRARAVVPYFWMQKTAHLVILLGALGIGARFLPQLDPFGKGSQREQIAKQQELLRVSRKSTELRAAMISKTDGGVHPEIERAVAQLENTFNTAKPAAKEANLRQLGEHQKELGQLWKQLSEEKLKSGLNPNAVNQGFGNADQKKIDQWKDELKKGDAAGLKKELAEMREMAKKLDAMPDSTAKQQLRDALQQRIGSLADAAAKELNSPQMNAALARALEQLQMAKNGDLSKEAMQAAQDSLQLSEQELSQLAQSVQDLKNLEDALKSLQMARQLNEGGKLDGEATGQQNGIADYMVLYEQMLAQQGGVGPGMRGPGQGQGGTAPRDDSLESGFQPEQSRAALTGGKMLLEWKTSAVSDPGTASKNYADAIKNVKQGVSEAVQHEQVPPGYHEAIQKYFDTLERPAGK